MDFSTRSTLSKSSGPYQGINIIEDYQRIDFEKSVYYSAESDEEDYTTLNTEKMFIENNLAFSPTQTGWEEINVSSDEDNEDNIDEEDPLTAGQMEKFLTDSGLNKDALHNILTRSQSSDESKGVLESITSGLVNVTWGLGKLIFNACEELTKYFWPPRWVLEKYECGVKNILPKLQELQSSIKINPQSTLATCCQPMVAALQEKDFPLAHSTFLIELRRILSSEAYKEEFQKFMQGQNNYDPLLLTIMELCRIRFEDGNFYNVFDDLMAEIGIEGTDKLCAQDFDIIDNVDPAKKLSFFEVNLKKFLGHINVNFDPHLQGNIPYIYDKLKMDEKTVNLMRMGTPTIEGCTGPAQIIEEFRGYLQDCVVKHKIHLYISLQNDKAKMAGTGDETGRNTAIKDLQNEFPNNFFVVVLAHDSNFYKQAGIHNKTQKTDDFFDVFKSELFGKDTGFYFPQAWKDDLKPLVDKLLKFVLYISFDGKEELTRQEKQDFIQIFYAYLALLLIDYSKADNANITCKDAIDRAGMLNALLEKLIMTIEGHVDTPESQRKHKVMTHAAAFWTKSQAIIKRGGKDPSYGRRERLLSADAHMNRTKESFKALVPGNTIKEFLSAAAA